MSTHEAAQIEEPGSILLSFAKCFDASSRDFVYVSTPITTGHRYLQWRSRHRQEALDNETDQAHRREVMEKNLQAAVHIVRRVRASMDCTVVDPSQLDDVPGWQQNDYHRFWAELIRRYVKIVVFVDGWQYSTGCAIEFLAACESGVTVLDQNLRQLEIEHAGELLQNAVGEFIEAGLRPDTLAETATRIRGLHDSHTEVAWR